MHLLKFVYYLTLFVMIFLIFFLSIIAVPFLMLMKTFSLFVFLFLLGASFGTVFDIVLYILEKIQKPKFMPEIFIPAIALISTFIITHFSNDLAKYSGLRMHDPLLVSIAYAGAFVLPYIIHKINFPEKSSSTF